jgi:hypothetical protein
MHSHPLLRRDKTGRSGIPREEVKVPAPRRQIIEGQRRRADDVPVKVPGERLRGLEALAAAGGAAEVVGLGVRAAVEGGGEELADEDVGVEGAVGEVGLGETSVFKGRNRVRIDREKYLTTTSGLL